MLRDHRKAQPLATATAAAWWAISFVVTIATYPFINDHFGRISAARQIVRFGEFPFRDFLDPGYVLTEFSSAGLQLLFGDNLLGEMLWTSAFIATGAVLVIILTRTLAPSRLSAILIAIVVIFAAPRPYDFDKFAFYPLGILLCWRYAERPNVRRLWALAAVAVVAGMFRYDNGIFIVTAGLATIVALHTGNRQTLARQAALFVAASAVCILPYLLFVQLNGGITNAAAQMATYAQREGRRTRLTELPSPVPSRLRVAYNPDHVQVRWAPSADGERARLETQYTLHNGVVQRSSVTGIWLYEIDDTSRRNLRALINDPRVVDTHLIERSTAQLREGPWWWRLYRQIPVLGRWTISWTAEDAANSLYWVFVLVPAAAVVMAWRRRRTDRVEWAKVLSAAIMAACIVALILRAPLIARLSGAAAPTIVLAAWLWRHVHRNWATGVLAVAVIVTAAVVEEWSSTLERLPARIKLHDVLAEATISPPSLQLLPAPSLSGLVGYVKRCTRPDDRVFAGWFVPELFFFSQRGFAGGVAALFGDHWSESTNQRRIVRKLASESVPLVILPNDARDLDETYTELKAYFAAHYHSVGAATFGVAEGPAFLLLARNDRAPTGTDPLSSLPCFADPE